MSPFKALATFVAGFGLLVAVGVGVSQSGVANAPTANGYGVVEATATSTHSPHGHTLVAPHPRAPKLDE